MQTYGRSSFCDRFTQQAADSDYSRHAKLQGASQYDIRAAASALWTLAAREGIDLSELNEGIVITAMLAQEQRWDNEDELVSTEFEEYWDATDAQGFSPGLRQDMQEELVRRFLDGKRKDHIVINDWDGIWTFRKADLWPDRVGV